MAKNMAINMYNTCVLLNIRRAIHWRASANKLAVDGQLEALC